MKIINISDLHGRRIWEDIIKQESFDHLVFIGDYFDTRDDISTASQIDNFKNIIKLKKENMDTVHLLIGNHDYHYLPGTTETYSGYQAAKALSIRDILKENIDLLQICYVNGDYLFTHAGVTNTWWSNNFEGEPPVDDSIEDIINEFFILEPKQFGFTGFHSRTGDEVTQSPLWVRPYSLGVDQIPHFTQVIGHTAVPHLTILKSIILTDTFDRTEEFLLIEDDAPKIKTLNNE